MRTITLEEHFVSRRFIDAGIDLGAQRGLDLSSSEVSDLTELRLRHMDESGIDMQVISHVLPTSAPIPPSQDQDIATAANDQAAAAIAAHPGRFAAFAALPMSDPQAAIAELRRAVTQLGFVGALINGRANGTFLDAPAYRPLLQTAVELDVPLYLHPGPPTATLREEHYTGFGPSVSYALRNHRLGLARRNWPARPQTDRRRHLRPALQPADHPRPHGRNDPLHAQPHRRMAHPSRPQREQPPALRCRNLPTQLLDHNQRHVLFPAVPAPIPNPRTRPTALLNRHPFSPND